MVKFRNPRAPGARAGSTAAPARVPRHGLSPGELSIQPRGQREVANQIEQANQNPRYSFNDFSKVFSLFDGSSIFSMADIFSMIFNSFSFFCMAERIFFQVFFNTFRLFSIGPGFVSMLRNIGTF
jgi:hypothetical protein